MNEFDIEQAREAQRAYAKEWRARNKDKVREKNLRYWVRRAKREAAARKAEAEKDGNNGTAET